MADGLHAPRTLPPTAIVGKALVRISKMLPRFVDQPETVANRLPVQLRMISQTGISLDRLTVVLDGDGLDRSRLNHAHLMQQDIDALKTDVELAALRNAHLSAQVETARRRALEAEERARQAEDRAQKAEDRARRAEAAAQPRPEFRHRVRGLKALLADKRLRIGAQAFTIALQDRTIDELRSSLRDARNAKPASRSRVTVPSFAYANRVRTERTDAFALRVEAVVEQLVQEHGPQSNAALAARLGEIIPTQRGGAWSRQQVWRYRKRAAAIRAN